MKRLLTVALALGFGAIAGAAHAVTVFSDDFSRPTSVTVGNGWTELQNAADDVAVISGNLRLRDSLVGLPDAAAASAVINATGFNNLEVMIRWRAFEPNESGDRFFVSWALDPRPSLSNEGAWNTVFNSDYTGTSYRTDTLSISPGADNSLFNLMLWTNVSDDSSGNREGFVIDYVKVTGDEIITAVPLPAALPLLAGGIGLLGAAGWRRKKNAAA